MSHFTKGNQMTTEVEKIRNQTDKKRRASQHLMEALRYMEEARGHVNHALSQVNAAGDSETAEALRDLSSDITQVTSCVMLIMQGKQEAAKQSQDREAVLFQ